MIEFLQPYWLFALLLLPLFFLTQKLKRRITSALAFSLLILALSNPIIIYQSRGGEIIYLWDSSRSMGLSSFPFQLPISKEGQEMALSFGDTKHTDIGEALKEGCSLLPAQGGKLVLISDGNDTGDKLNEGIKACQARGIKVDVLPYGNLGQDASVSLHTLEEASLGSLVPFTVEIVSQGIDHLNLLLSFDDQTLEKELDLKEGLNVLPYSISFSEEGIHTISAKLLIEDTFAENNISKAFISVLKRKGILIVSNQPSTEAFASFLKSQDIPLVSISPASLPKETYEFSAYEGVVLDDVSREELTDSQVEAIKSYIRNLGGGLLVIGGGHSFTLGSYFGSDLEEALPVLSRPLLEKDIPDLAIVLVVDNSSSMWRTSAGIQKLDLAEEVALQAAFPLRESDQVGVLFFADQPYWILELSSGRTFENIKDEIMQRGPGGGTNVFYALEEAYKSLKESTSSLKHVILISDGKSTEGEFENIVSQARQSGIYTSAVAVGEDADMAFMQNISSWGEGRFAQVTSDKGVPSLTLPPQVKAEEKAFEEGSFSPQQTSISFFEPRDLPPLSGYLKATAKDRAMTIYSILPENSPLLALWSYGQGRVACWLTDFAGPWASWTGWDGITSFWSEILSWIAPPQDELSVFYQISGSELIFNSFWQSESPTISCVALLEGPESKSLQMQIPRRGLALKGSFPLEESGAYTFSLFQGDKKYTCTFWFPAREVEEIAINDETLSFIVSMTGGKILSAINQEIGDDLPFIQKSFSLRPWLCLLAILLFLLGAFKKV